MTPDLLPLVRHFESLHLRAYPDPKTGGAPWTIGYGHTHGVQPGDTCTELQAEEWMAEELAECARQITLSSIRPFEEHQLDALSSFLYNVGPGKVGVKDGLFSLKSGGHSTLWKMVKAQNDAGAAEQFLRWINPGTNVAKGLLRRRVAERALWLGEDWQEALMMHQAKGG